MFNPFALPGPQFLLFYLLFGVLVCVVLHVCIGRLEGCGARVTPLALLKGDPYLIAYLRDGAKEAMKVVTIALVDRGLVHEHAGKLKLARADAQGLVNRPFEREVLAMLTGELPASHLLVGASSLPALRAYRNVLIDNALLCGLPMFFRRLLLALAAWAALWGVCGFKIAHAIAQGRHNLGFLPVLSIAFSLYVLVPLLRRKTRCGSALLDDLKLLFQHLKKRADRISPGGKSNEAALLAAVFGIGLLPAAAFPYVNRLYPQLVNGGGGGGGDGGGGDGGGGDSSCGGGGGGGCGGCGS